MMSSEKIDTTIHSPVAYNMDFIPTFLICETEIFDPIKNKVVTNNCLATVDMFS